MAWKLIVLVPVKEVLTRVGNFIPTLVGVLIILIGGWLIAKFAQKVVTQVLHGGTVPDLVITPSTMVDIDTPENLLGWELDKGITAFPFSRVPQLAETLNSFH